MLLYAKVVIALHVVLYFTESLPFLQTLFSIICHVVYLQNFSNTWPLISLSSISFVASCGLVIVDHFMWFFYFAQLTENARQYRYRGRPGPQAPSFSEITTFFGLCVWLVPLFLFLSLSANDNALPTMLATPGTPSLAATQPPQSRVSLFRSLFSFTSFLPAAIRPKSSQTPEGLIAPRPSSPGPQTYMRSQPMSSPSLSGTMTPPRSPGPRQGSFDAPLNNTNFRLNTPPPRASTLGPDGAMRRKTSSSLGIGGHDSSKKDS
ncbi:erv26 super protein [Marasmius sp. AFHP31]|nr:erv26 super protein [Marasmius sp. AFHP31]